MCITNKYNVEVWGENVFDYRDFRVIMYCFVSGATYKVINLHSFGDLHHRSIHHWYTLSKVCTSNP